LWNQSNLEGSDGDGCKAVGLCNGKNEKCLTNGNSSIRAKPWYSYANQWFLGEFVPNKKLLPDEVLDEVDSRNLLL
jgi:hypothetical protein